MKPELVRFIPAIDGLVYRDDRGEVMLWTEDVECGGDKSIEELIEKRGIRKGIPGNDWPLTQGG